MSQKSSSRSSLKSSRTSPRRFSTSSIKRSIRKIKAPLRKQTKRALRRLRKMRKAAFRNLIGGYIRAGSLPVEQTKWESESEFPPSQPQISGDNLQSQEFNKN
jgi:hypothetical protein